MLLVVQHDTTTRQGLESKLCVHLVVLDVDHEVRFFGLYFLLLVHFFDWRLPRTDFVVPVPTPLAAVHAFEDLPFGALPAGLPDVCNLGVWLFNRPAILANLSIVCRTLLNFSA